MKTAILITSPGEFIEYKTIDGHTLRIGGEVINGIFCVRVQTDISTTQLEQNLIST